MREIALMSIALMPIDLVSIVTRGRQA